MAMRGRAGRRSCKPEDDNCPPGTVPLDQLVRRRVNEAKEKTVEKISGADLLGMRAHAKEAENYVLACGAYVDRLTRAHLALQVENVRLRKALEDVRHELTSLRVWDGSKWEYHLSQVTRIARVCADALTPNVRLERWTTACRGPSARRQGWVYVVAVSAGDLLCRG